QTAPLVRLLSDELESEGVSLPSADGLKTLPQLPKGEPLVPRRCARLRAPRPSEHETPRLRGRPERPPPELDPIARQCIRRRSPTRPRHFRRSDQRPCVFRLAREAAMCRLLVVR